MTLTDVKISVPLEMVSYITSDDEIMDLERNALLLYPYIKNLKISHGRAAEILGIRKFELIEIYNQLGLSYYNLDIEEVEEDVLTYKRLKGAAV